MKLDGTVVCFDLDDTLVSECDYVESGLLAAGEALDAELPGPSPSGPWLVALWRKERAPDAFQRLLRERGLSEELWVPRLKQVYRSHEPALRLREGASELVDAIARSSGRLALVTDGHASAQRAKWSALRLPAPFHPVVFTDDMGRRFWKPHPWGFEQVMSAHPGARFVYVADNPAKDFIAPNRLGWTTIMVRDVRNVHPQRFEHGTAAPGCCVDSLAGVLPVIPHS
jgi:putative hydrolase of the HAD superfamily